MSMNVYEFVCKLCVLFLQLEGYWFAIMSRTDRSAPHVTAIEIELSADRKTMTTFLATSQYVQFSYLVFLILIDFDLV